MTYSTLMVHLELGRSNAGLLKITGQLAQRFHAAVIGIAACQPMPMAYSEGFVSADLIEQDRAGIARAMEETEAEFRGALQSRVALLEWRSTQIYASISDYLAQEARSADLIITRAPSGDQFDASRSLSTGDLVMHAGRPVLIVPAAAGTPAFDRVVVAWKDTREARRAACDALPLLKAATEVCVVEIAAEDELTEARMRLNDVVGWLHRHGVQATSLAEVSSDDNAAALIAIAHERRADVIVAGAYGHSRLREWALGGMTRDLLHPADRCSLVSH
ncbi:MAG: universal stress protein [Pseudomonadota bacterium]|nr:universal stress protein [Pseudomonadota bacterium]